MKRKVFIIILTAIASVIFALSLSGCVNPILSRRFDGMKEFSYVEWYWQGENAEIRLRQIEEYSRGYANVTVDGKDYIFNWQVGYSSAPGGGLILTIPYEKASELPDSQEYKKGNKYKTRFDALYKDNAIRSTVKVTLFGVEYESVVLEKRDLDRSTVKPMEYFKHNWRDENESLYFKMETKEECFGTAKDKFGNEVEIFFIFEWGNIFKLFKTLRSSNGPEPELLAEGMYTNVEKTAVLTFTTNELFDFNTLEITATHKE